jgi:hypothetical protein
VTQQNLNMSNHMVLWWIAFDPEQLVQVQTQRMDRPPPDRDGSVSIVRFVISYNKRDKGWLCPLGSFCFVRRHSLGSFCVVPERGCSRHFFLLRRVASIV